MKLIEYKTQKQAVPIIQQKLLNYDAVYFQVPMKKKKWAAGFGYDFYTKLYQDDGISMPGDYIYHVLDGDIYIGSSKDKRIRSGMKYYYQGIIAPDKTKKAKRDLKQLKQVDKVLTASEKDILSKASTDYEKVWWAHQYLCEQVQYDYSYKLHSHRMWGLLNGELVCDGYSAVLYKLLRDLGVGCRMIESFPNGEASTGHAFNIVRVDGKWYWMDACWDDGDPKPAFQYFLKGSDDFELKGFHTPAGKYLTDEFKKAFPISKESYPLKDLSV